MHLMPVLDVRGGRVVHAVGGRRDHYGPLRSVLHPGNDPIELAEVLRRTFGFESLYVADLDALAGGPVQRALWERLRGEGFGIWLDAGVRTAAEVPALWQAVGGGDPDVRGAGEMSGPPRPVEVGPRVRHAGSRVILALESLVGPGEIRLAIEAVGRWSLAFSLDLHEGRPVTPDGAVWGPADPFEIAQCVLEMGIDDLIVLDLGRVGTGRGAGTESLVRRLRAYYPGARVIAGGGIAGVEDVRRLGRAGAWGVLVASTVYDGRITPVMLRDL